MKVYLAGAWSRREEIHKVAKQLKRMGVEITARWLEEPESPKGASRDKWLRETALVDVEDVLRADAIVRFSDADVMGFPLASAKLVSGARMFEMGLAWGNNKPVIVVGGHQNVFDYLPNITHVKDIEQLYKWFSLYEGAVEVTEKRELALAVQ